LWGIDQNFQCRRFHHGKQQSSSTSSGCIFYFIEFDFLGDHSINALIINDILPGSAKKRKGQKNGIVFAVKKYFMCCLVV
jgi:hypothetical protein